MKKVNSFLPTENWTFNIDLENQTPLLMELLDPSDTEL